VADPLSAIRLKTRLVVELRYPAIPSLLDRRGAIIDKIHPQIERRFPVWSVETAKITWTDQLPPKASEFDISLKRAAVILEDVPTHDFVETAIKCMRLVHEALEPALSQVDRIGVRFIEILGQQRECDFETIRSDVFSRFHKMPFKLPLNYTDSAYILEHQKGRFVVAPTNGKDEWALRNFRVHDNLTTGYAIDIDSYHKNIKIKGRDGLVKAVQDVLDVSKGVELALARGLGLVNE
jgi:hypothetical protein